MNRCHSAELKTSPSLRHEEEVRTLSADTVRGGRGGHEQSPRASKAHLQETIRNERRAVLLVNKRSRRGAQFYAEVRRLLESRGIAVDPEYCRLDATRLSSLVADAIACGHKFIIVGGGDGTLSSVLQHFAYRDVVLGILPLGTANSFARTLGIPVELEAAVDVLLSGKVVDVDLGRIGERYFCTMASVGLAAKVAREMRPVLKKWLGRMAYLVIGAAQLRRYGAFRCVVTADGRQTALDALEVRVANGGYQGGILVVQEACAESRDLVMHITRGCSTRDLIKVWLRLTAGLPPDPADLEILRSGQFLIDANPPQYVSIDGEAFIQTPFEVSVARQSLLVMVPEDEDSLE